MSTKRKWAHVLYNANFLTSNPGWAWSRQPRVTVKSSSLSLHINLFTYDSSSQLIICVVVCLVSFSLTRPHTFWGQGLCYLVIIKCSGSSPAPGTGRDGRLSPILLWLVQSRMAKITPIRALWCLIPWLFLNSEHWLYLLLGLWHRLPRINFSWISCLSEVVGFWRTGVFRPSREGHATSTDEWIKKMWEIIYLSIYLSHTQTHTHTHNGVLLSHKK